MSHTNKTPSTSSTSPSDTESRTNSEDENPQTLDSLVTEFFTKWNCHHLSRVWRRRYDELTSVCKGFFNFLFDGTQPNQPSIYFTNDAMKNMIMAFALWSPWIPGDQCGLHRKFKDTVGALCHIITTIEELKCDKSKLKEFNSKIDSISEVYCDLDDLLLYGMFLQELFSLCFFLIEISAQLLCFFSKQVKMLNIWQQNDHREINRIK